MVPTSVSPSTTLTMGAATPSSLTNTPGGSAKESPYVKYQEAARLDLPCLHDDHGELPDHEDEADPEKEASETNLASPDMVPGTPQSLRVTQLRGTPKVTVEGTPQQQRAMAKPPQSKVCIL